MKRIIFIILLFPFILNAQKYTVSGYIEDAETGEKLAAATFFVENAPQLGTMTNAYGFYSLKVPMNELKVVASYVGYAAQVHQLNLTKDTILNIRLNPSIELDEIEVIGKISKAEDVQIGKIEVSVQTIKNMPVLLGEVDVLKSIQLLPGIQSGTEGTSGIYVRGGGPDQNLILIDGVPVYNVNHLFGFFSVFNADAIRDVSVIKGGFPARYGGRLSSVIDIRMREGNNKKFSGAASIGIISSKFLFEGPIVKDRASFLISFRRTYLDLLTLPFQKWYSQQDDSGSMQVGYYFWDLNAKLNYKVSEKDRIYLSAYTGRDKFYTNMEFEWDNEREKGTGGINWGNITSALRWNRALSKTMFGNLTVTYSNYNFVTGFEEEYNNFTTNESSTFGFEYFSEIEDFGTKLDFDYFPSPNHKIKFGANYIYHTFKPGVSTLRMGSNSQTLIDTTLGNRNLYANEYSVYAEDEMTLFKGFKINAGGHYSGFIVRDTFYHSVQPRISMRYLFTPDFSFKAAYSHMSQYLHLLTNATVGLPTDLWLPATKTVLPQNSVQYAAGLVYSFNKQFDVSIEGYYKTMDNLIEYKEGASYFGLGDDLEDGMSAWEKNIETEGEGESYGAEILIKKNYGKTTGWIGYTLSWSNRQFSNINFGEKFPYNYDRRHDIGIVITHKFNDRIDVGLTWVYGTGNAITLALEKYQSIITADVRDYMYYFQPTTDHIDRRNNFRIPPYHRLDIGINLRKEKKYGKRTWSFGVYNAYNRQNPFFVDFGRNKAGDRVLMQYSFLPIIPSISYRYEF